jgi:hypothetical protein
MMQCGPSGSQAAAETGAAALGGPAVAATQILPTQIDSSPAALVDFPRCATQSDQRRK